MFLGRGAVAARPVEVGYEGKEVLELLAHKCEACGKPPSTKHDLHIHEARWVG